MDDFTIAFADAGLDDEDPDANRKLPKMISPVDPCSASTAKANTVRTHSTSAFPKRTVSDCRLRECSTTSVRRAFRFRSWNNPARSIKTK